jgi:hypothetical protein
VDFEWDPEKEKRNIAKHGVSFAEAMTVFADPLELMIANPVHSTTEFDLSAWVYHRPAACWLWLTPSAVSAFGSSVRGPQPQESKSSMNQAPNPDQEDDLRPEYDFSGGVRGKHHEAHRKGTNVVFLDPDIAQVFRDSESVNGALRLLLELAKEQVPTGHQAGKRCLSS